MMRKTSSFLLGLFVVGGVLLATVAVIWLGVSRYFHEGTRYVTYFDESVQGLAPDSAVKYRGVQVGRVESIGVAPDNRLVEVVLRIDDDGALEHDAVAQLKAAGITGVVFVELDRPEPGETPFRPDSGFTPDYPLVPSRLSAMKDMMAEIDEVLDHFAEVDFRGISDRTKAVLDRADGLLADDRIGHVLTRLEAAAGSLSDAAARVERLTSDGRLDQVLAEAGAAMAEGRGLLAEARDELGRLRLAERADHATRGLDALLAQGRDAAGGFQRLVAAVERELAAMKLGETAARAGRLAGALDQRTRHLTADVRDATTDVRQVMEALNRLLERLNASPSDLLFSRRPAPLETSGTGGEGPR